MLFLIIFLWLYRTNLNNNHIAVSAYHKYLLCPEST